MSWAKIEQRASNWRAQEESNKSVQIPRGDNSKGEQKHNSWSTWVTLEDSEYLEDSERVGTQDWW